MSILGAAIGSAAGGWASRSAAELVYPTAEELFWKNAYAREPYYVAGRPFEYYAPGFRAGWAGRVRHDGPSFAEAEPVLVARYGLTKSDLDPAWHDIRSAARAAWDRVDRYRQEEPQPALAPR